MSIKYPQLRNRDWLYRKYWKERLSASEIAKEIGCSHSLVLRWIKKLSIQTRSLSEARRLQESIQYSEVLDRDWLYKKYWEEGLTTYEIADELDCSRSIVWRCMNELNIPRRQATQRVGKYLKYPQLYNADWLREQYVEKGLSSPNIAESLGCDSSLVSRALVRVGIERRKRSSYLVGNYKYPELRDKDWLVQKYITEGLDTKEVATTLGCSPTSVVIALNSFRIPICLNYKYRKLNDKDFLIQRYIVERKSMGDIAMEVGCVYSNIHNCLTRFGIPRRTVKEASCEEGTRRKKSKNLKELWKDKDFVKTIFDSQNVKPNKFESRIDQVLQRFIPNEWKYNGNFDCEILIGGLIPDFVNINGRKQLIEGFGDPFHDGTFSSSWKRTEFGRKAVFSQFGYDVLILWYSDVNKMTDEKIAEVVKAFMEQEGKRKKSRKR